MMEARALMFPITGFYLWLDLASREPVVRLLDEMRSALPAMRGNTCCLHSKQCKKSAYSSNVSNGGHGSAHIVILPDSKRER